jgi:serine/threonine-protein kinase
VSKGAASQGLEGRALGRYRLRYRLAEGGMAAVYLAQLAGDRGFERWVAIKVVHPQHSEDRRFVDMLFDEARTSARIHHPNVCAVLDYGEQDGLVYLVMEYLEGESLSSVLRRAWGSPKGAPRWLISRIIADAARGLHAAHELTDTAGKSYGIVHRDVSPQNLLVLYDGLTRVVDFGIARARGRLVATRAGEVKGKISYLAPEQLLGGEVDRRADVWSLGVVLWEATLGKRLFRGENAAQTAHNVVDGPIAKPTKEEPGYPPELESIVMSALARDKGSRTSTTAELADALESFLYRGGRPAGTAQVSRYMKKHFDDRLAVRRGLVGSDDSGEIMVVQELQSETTLGSQLVARPPGRLEESGSRRLPPSNESSVSSLEDVDGEIAAIRARNRRQKRLVGALALLALAAAGAAAAYAAGLIP